MMRTEALSRVDVLTKTLSRDTPSMVLNICRSAARSAASKSDTSPEATIPIISDTEASPGDERGDGAGGKKDAGGEEVRERGWTVFAGANKSTSQAASTMGFNPMQNPMRDAPSNPMHKPPPHAEEGDAGGELGSGQTANV